MTNFVVFIGLPEFIALIQFTDYKAFSVRMISVLVLNFVMLILLLILHIELLEEQNSFLLLFIINSSIQNESHIVSKANVIVNSKMV